MQGWDVKCCLNIEDYIADADLSETSIFSLDV